MQSSAPVALGEVEVHGPTTDILEAARSGDSSAVRGMSGDPAALLARTPDEGNTCLHIASIHGNQKFCDEVLAINLSLLSAVNGDGETPLLTAVRKSHESLASHLLRWCRFCRLRGAILKQDKHGCNALHHAIRGGHRKLALELIEAEPALSQAVNEDNESPMFLAVKSPGCEDVFEKLVKTSTSSYNGGHGHNALQRSSATTTMTRTVEMDRLLEAATTGNNAKVASLAMGPDVLSGTTPAGNTFLHIASVHGHGGFLEAVLGRVGEERFLHLLDAVNTDGETPLLVAVTAGHISLASFFVSMYGEGSNSEALLKQDKLGCNVLHHAIRNGHRELAMELIAKAPALSRAVNKYGESPMFIAVMRDYQDVFCKLLETEDHAVGGAGGYNALHAAVRNGNLDIAQRIMEKHGQLAREENMHKETPVHLAVVRDWVDVLRVLLKCDRSLGYVSTSDGIPLLNLAATRGRVSAARAILEHCPDTPYATPTGWTCLHVAVKSDQMEFVNFVLTSKQLRKLVNMRDDIRGQTALHLSVRDSRPHMVKALLRHRDIDVTVLTNNGTPATWVFNNAIKSAKSLHWNEVSMLLLNADPKRATNIYNLHKEIKDKITDESRKNVKALTETYTRNTSIVAILMASITFAAAFTLSGWYRNDDAAPSHGQGLPIMAKKFAFQAFLISDTLAMCFSLSVAFICIVARWEDFEFLLYYRSVTVKIMWLAYMATITAFATGLYMVLAPHLLRWAIAICCLPVLVPILTLVLGKWHVLELRLRLGQKFKPDLLDMV
ncbi:hypothetical protein BS78_K221700 [Paspalum vaginatum]|uniref:PGG domain-containing protein n=1 Tax=Paspalum vaginatum TaxID=158149 RepID=A0A9W8CF30_9POAL|nr:hypothetical protein BS78_K221700 [Paspalum vaginatum]